MHDSDRQPQQHRPTPVRDAGQSLDQLAALQSLEIQRLRLRLDRLRSGGPQAATHDAADAVIRIRRAA